MVIIKPTPRPALSSEQFMRDGIRIMRRAFVNTDAKCMFGIYAIPGKRKGRFYWAIAGHKGGLLMRCKLGHMEAVAVLLLEELGKLRAMGRAAAA